MTIFTQEYDPDKPAAFALPPATRRPSGWGERFSAGVDAGRIEDDSWARSAQIENDYVAEIETDLAAFRGPDFERTGRSGRHTVPDGESYIPGMNAATSPEVMRQRKRQQTLSLIASAKAAEPEKWAHLPDNLDAFDAEVISRRQAEYDEAVSILNSAPDGAWFGAEFAGRGWAGMTDPISIATLPLGGPAAKGAWGIGKFIVTEALIGAGSELAIAPRRQEVAADLDVPEPDLLTDVATAALVSGGFAGALSGVAKGVQRYFSYRKDRAAAAGGATPPGVSPGQNEGRIRQAGETLTTGTAEPQTPGRHVDWSQFDFTPSGNASPQSNRVGYVYGRLIERGMPPHVAAGFVGNFMVEAGVNIDPRAVGDGGRAIGMGQWNDRGPKLVEFARKRGKDWSDLDTQIDFLMHELETSEAVAKQKIWATNNPVDAALAVSRHFERPGTPHNERRVGFARSIYEQANSGAVPKYAGLAVSERAYSEYNPTTRGYTGSGQVAVGDRRLDVEYVVVDASLLTRASGRFQPRDRSRINSDAWIAETAARLDPALLMPSPTAAHGAPLVGPDMMIESGNGRFSVIERAYAMHPDRAVAYQQAITAQGFDIPAGMERPVLVAKRLTGLTDDERVQVAIDAQDGGTARMTATERARTTARDMTAERLASFVPSARMGDDANRPFLQSVLSTQSASERNALFDKGGALNADGRRMLKNAFFARAWDDGSPLGGDVLDRYAEAEDAGELKSLMDALEEAAPAMATLKAEIEAGKVRPEFDITAHVLDAIGAITQARKTAGRIGSSVAEAIEIVLGHDDLFAGPNPLSIALLRKFWRDGRAAPAAEIGQFLNRYAEEARAAGRTGDLMGATPAEVLRAIDAKTFGDLPDEIPPVAPAPMPRVEDAALPESAFAKGADSPEAEAADQLAMEELKQSVGRAAMTDIDRQIILERARFEDEGDFDLPDGTRASDLLADIDEDQNLLDVLDACLIGGNRQ